MSATDPSLVVALAIVDVVKVVVCLVAGAEVVDIVVVVEVEKRVSCTWGKFPAQPTW